MKFTYTVGGETLDLMLERSGNGYKVTLNEQSYPISNVRVNAGVVEFTLNGQKIVTRTALEPQKVWVAAEGQTYALEKPRTTGRKRGGMGAGAGGHVAPMPGQVREVLVTVGDTVEQGQTLLLLEAMKMEIRIQAALDGVVKALHVDVGQQVDKDATLVEIEAEETA